MGKTIAIAGAGLSGATLARRLAEAGVRVRVFESEPVVGGACRTERDASTGILVHLFGPHAFHTSEWPVWEFVNRFAEMRPFDLRVKARVKGRTYPLPINLATLEQFFGVDLDPDRARTFLAEKCLADADEGRSFEERALRLVGPALYEGFFKHFTEKHWGRSATEIPASVLARLPLRFNYDDRYHGDTWQAIPEAGYTGLIAAMLDHPLIETSLGTRLERSGLDRFAHTFWTGPLDAFFGHSLGRLPYRTLRFEEFRREGEAMGCPQINWCDPDVPWTRVTEHKFLAPWETHSHTIVYREYPAECGPEDMPLYPVRLVDGMEMLTAYTELARSLAGVTFVGRLATFRYINMDVAVKDALAAAESFLAGGRQAFARDPLA